MTWTEYEEFNDPVDMFFLLWVMALAFMCGYLLGGWIWGVIS
jgi:hypothetical protein